MHSACQIKIRYSLRELVNQTAVFIHTHSSCVYTFIHAYIMPLQSVYGFDNIFTHRYSSSAVPETTAVMDLSPQGISIILDTRYSIKALFRLT